MLVRAFNLVPGTVILRHDGQQPFAYVIDEVNRNDDTESVHVRLASWETWHKFDYNDEVEVIGLTPHHKPWSSDGGDDIGTDYSYDAVADLVIDVMVILGHTAESSETLEGAALQAALYHVPISLLSAIVDAQPA